MPSPAMLAMQKQISAGIALAQANMGAETGPTTRKGPTRKRVPTEKGAIYAQEVAADKENVQQRKKRTSKPIHRVESDEESADLGDKDTENTHSQPLTIDFTEIRNNSAYASIPMHTPSPHGTAPFRTSSVGSDRTETSQTRSFGSQVNTNIQRNTGSPPGVPIPVYPPNVPNATPTLPSIPTPIQQPRVHHEVLLSQTNAGLQTPGVDHTSNPRQPEKRAHSPSLSSTGARSSSPEREETGSSPRKRRRGQSSRNRPKLQDLEAGPKIAVLTAIQDYRSRLATQNPFPTPSEENTMAGASLVRACISCLVSLEKEQGQLFDSALTLIIARDSQMRGELKCKLCPLVQSIYGFRSLGSQSAMTYNRKRHDLLKSENRLAFKDFKARKGLYENPIIQQAINVMWFRDSSDEGVKYAEYFNPIPLQTIALILTTVEHIIDLWASGTFKGRVAFSEREYVNVYARHLGALEELKNYSEPASKKLHHIQKRLYSRARRHSGAIKEANVVPLLEEEDLEAFAGDGEQDSSKSEESGDEAADAGQGSDDYITQSMIDSLA